jgi:hypothetical protein
MAVRLEVLHHPHVGGLLKILDGEVAAVGGWKHITLRALAASLADTPPDQVGIAREVQMQNVGAVSCLVRHK